MADEFKHLSAGTSLTQGEYEAVGGHVFACQATGDIVYASSGSQLSRLGKGAANTVLAMGGSCIPAWTASPSVTDLTIGGGCITLSAATDIDLLDNNASALSFDASGKTGIIDIVTTNCSEGVTMSGTLGVTGVLTANAGVVVDNFTLDGTELDLSSGDFALDVAGDVEINADGGCVNFKDASLALAAIVNSSCVGELRIHEAANYVGFKAPALSGNQIWTLPAAVASCACDVLTCNGSGVLSWATAGGGAVSAVANGSDNRIATFSSSTALNGEQYLTYTGGSLEVAIASGDPKVVFDIGGTDEWFVGVDDSADDALKIGTGGTVGANCAIIFGADGNVYLGCAADTAFSFGGKRASNIHAGTAAAPSIAFTSDSNTGIYRPASDEVAIVGGAQEYLRVACAGKMLIRDTANGNMTIGMTLNQQATDNEILALKSSDVTHGYTHASQTEADTYGVFRKWDNNGAGCGGGLKIRGYSCASTVAMGLEGFTYTTTSTKSTSADGAFIMRAYTRCGDTGQALGGTANLVLIKDGNTARFIFGAGGDADADCGWTTYSDARLKSNQEPVPYGLSEINQLTPKVYCKDSGAVTCGVVTLEGNLRHQIGFIAQEVLPLIPEAVAIPEDPCNSWYSMDNGNLVPVIVKAVQELSTRVEALEAK